VKQWSQFANLQSSFVCCYTLNCISQFYVLLSSSYDSCSLTKSVFCLCYGMQWASSNVLHCFRLRSGYESHFSKFSICFNLCWSHEQQWAAMYPKAYYYLESIVHADCKAHFHLVCSCISWIPSWFLLFNLNVNFKLYSFIF